MENKAEPKSVFNQVMIGGSFFVGVGIFAFAGRYPEPTSYLCFMVGLSLGYVARNIEKRLKDKAEKAAVT